MGKHRTGRKYTGAKKIEKNSFLGNQILNTHKQQKHDHYNHNSQFTTGGMFSQTDESDFALALERAAQISHEFEQRTRIVQDPDVEFAQQHQLRANFISTEQRLLRIPRRPVWNQTMTAKELHQAEEQAFQQWRARIAAIEETRVVALSPFEKNLGFWRQLWRVVELSDVVLQLVDAREPLLFYSKDLVQYAKQVGILQRREKRCILVLNKADLVPLAARQRWAEYFEAKGIDFVYFSALREEAYIKLLKNIERDEGKQLAERELQMRLGLETVDFDQLERQRIAELTLADDDDVQQRSALQSQQSGVQRTRGVGVLESQVLFKTERQQQRREAREIREADKLERLIPIPRVEMKTDDSELPDQFDVEAVLSGAQELPQHICSAKIYTRQQLVSLVRALSRRQLTLQAAPAVKATTGVIGYPNIGKSSTINVLALHTGQRTSVGETPGKTKHFQTIELCDDLTLCDCPGLVLPQFAHSRAHFVLGGVLPIDQERDYVSAIHLLCRRVPASVFEKTYQLELKPPDKFATGVGMQHGTQAKGCYHCDAEQLLASMAQVTGAERGKCARRLVKDLFVGKIRWIQLPPVGVRPVERQAKVILRRPNAPNVEDELGRDMAHYERARRLMAQADEGQQPFLCSYEEQFEAEEQCEEQ